MELRHGREAAEAKAEFMEDKIMSNEFKDLDTAPTLTLDPFQSQEEKKPPVAQKPEDPALDDSILTEEERRQITNKRK